MTVVRVVVAESVLMRIVLDALPAPGRLRATGGGRLCDLVRRRGRTPSGPTSRAAPAAQGPTGGAIGTVTAQPSEIPESR